MIKMSKFKLLLLGLFSFIFIGFTNAGDVSVNFSCGGDYNSNGYYNCTPSYEFGGSAGDYFKSNIECKGSYKLQLTYYKNGSLVYGPGTYFCNSDGQIINTNFYIDGGFDEVRFSSQYAGSFSTVINNPNYNENNILPYGKLVFKGTMSKFNNVFTEFLPYLVYIGLGIIGLLVGFVGIKRLINRVRSKVFSSFR